MTTNDQYVVVLTDQVIYFYSAFDSQSLIFTHNLEELSAPALGIYLNKNSLLMTHIDSSVITTFVIRNKTLKVQNSTILEINHCRKIVNVFQNSINFEIYCVVEYF